MPHDIRPVPATATYAPRQAWLRPLQSPEEVGFEGDSAEGALHLAVFQRGDIVAIASVLPERPSEPHRPGDWRLRGMATDPEVRGRGLGRTLVDAASEHAIALGGTAIWCHARTSAQGFYAALDFIALDDAFEVPSLGPHVFMWRCL